MLVALVHCSTSRRTAFVVVVAVVVPFHPAAAAAAVVILPPVSLAETLQSGNHRGTIRSGKNGLVHSYTTMGGPTVTTIVTTIVVFAAGSLSRDNRCGRGRGIRGVVIVRLPERVVRPIIVFDNVLVGDPILSQQELHQHGQHSGSIFSLDAMEHDCVIVVSSLVVMLLLLLLMIRMFFFIVLLLSSNRCCCCCWQSYRCFCRCRHFSLLTIERHCLQGQTQAILPRWCFQNGLVEARQSACVEFGHYGVVELGVDVYAGG
mmetsp:Transcript_14180/g.30051  ORF Transcript_14180/g.30051 Transcript_14180/m.30051 type:complete len:261 (+) Transcript_14180:233-1015(+)